MAGRKSRKSSTTLSTYTVVVPCFGCILNHCSSKRVRMFRLSVIGTVALDFLAVTLLHHHTQ